MIEQILGAATIIKNFTIDQKTESLNILSIIILIRTVLGWTVVLETNGRWSWQSARSITTIQDVGASN